MKRELKAEAQGLMGEVGRREDIHHHVSGKNGQEKHLSVKVKLEGAAGRRDTAETGRTTGREPKKPWQVQRRRV